MPVPFINYKRAYGKAARLIYERRKENPKNPLPWQRAYTNIRQRCNNPKASKYIHYGGKGIKSFVTLEDLKIIYYRDEAWKLKQASIDRIDPDKDYSIDNIQWIEMSRNRGERRVRHLPQCKEYPKVKESFLTEIKNINLDRRMARICLWKLLVEI